MVRMLCMLRRVPVYWWLFGLGVAAVALQHTIGWPRTGQFLGTAARVAGGLVWRIVWAVWPLLLVGLMIGWFRWDGRRMVLGRLGRTPRRPLLFGLASVGVLGVLVMVVVVLPPVFVPDGAIAQPRDLYRARNDVRTTLLQAVAGMVLLLGAYFTYRQVQAGRAQVELARSGQVTERFTRAIEQLGSETLDVRLGGIYALERIAHDSTDDRATVAEVLCAFVREHAPWPSNADQVVADASPKVLPSLQARKPDVQAVLTILGRGGFTAESSSGQAVLLDLNRTDLRYAILNNAILTGTNLNGANLTGAALGNTNLTGAVLTGANLTDAILIHANLTNSILIEADLTEASLTEASLTGAALIRANLTGATLVGADLVGAHLLDAALTGARADKTTRWSDDFDWETADVLMI